MSLTLTERACGDVSVVAVKGRLILGEETSEFRDFLRALIGSGKKKILLDLVELRFADSSGIGELVHIFTIVTDKGGALKLLRLTKQVKDYLNFTKLQSVFEVFEDEALALGSFG